MKEQILALRAEGKTYPEIQAIVGCSRGTISYHCGDGQKAKCRQRLQETRKNNSLLQKVDSFLHPGASRKRRRKLDEDIVSTPQKQIYDKIREFSDKKSGSFSYIDVLEKFGEQPSCYLTGRHIDLAKPRSFSFDHKIPSSKGGDNSLSNLGVTCREANLAKSDLLLEDFLRLCIDVLEHHGYDVRHAESEQFGVCEGSNPSSDTSCTKV